MSTIREQIVSAALTALNTSRPAGVPNVVERSRLFAIDTSSLPAMTIYPNRDAVFDVGGRRGPKVRRVLTLLVECRAKGQLVPTPVSSDAATDPLCAWAVKTLCDNSLGGLANDISESETTFEYDQATEGQVCVATVAFQIDYESLAANAESRTDS